ncbi:MAG: hypothetical protein NTY38_32935 [Acidobacteria bacterium]|nr:hypothetical protein [Acidobacteriota bacterium]
MKYYQFLLWIVGLGLQVLVLGALVRGAFRKFPATFVYSICLFLTTVIEISAATDVGLLNYKSWQQYFYYDELARQTGILAIVVSLILKATPEGPKRGPFARLVVAGAFLFWALSLYLCYSPKLGHWMNAVDRNLSFGSAILNLLLWMRLIAHRNRDRQILLVSGGLGLQMAGQAIGMSLIALSRDFWIAGSSIAVIASFLCSYVWWRALRKMPALQPGGNSAPALSSSSRESRTGS